MAPAGAIPVAAAGILRPAPVTPGIHKDSETT